MMKKILLAAIVLLSLLGSTSCKRTTVSGTILSYRENAIILRTTATDTVRVSTKGFKAQEDLLVGDQVDILCSERTNGLRAKEIKLVKPSFLRMVLGKKE